MAKETPKAKTPDFHVFVVEEREGKDPFWWRIGAAWVNKDEKGYSVEFMTPNGPARLVLREPKEDSKSWPPGGILIPLATPRGVASLSTKLPMISITPQSTAQALEQLVRAQLTEIEQLAQSGEIAVSDARVAHLVAQIADNIEALTGSHIVPPIDSTAGRDAVLSFTAAVRQTLDRHGPTVDSEFPF